MQGMWEEHVIFEKEYLEVGFYCIIGQLLIFGKNCLISWKGPHVAVLRPTVSR